MSALRARSWSPYVVGAAIGLLSVAAFATADHGLGITTAFEHSAALLAAPAEYLAAKSGDEAPRIGWEWMLVVGVFFGALVSSKLSGDRRHDAVPALWRARFGPSPAKRYAAAFGGGLLLMLGARIAQGCTSGHGITGALQLAVSSWVFSVTFFLVGVAVARALFPASRKELDHVRTAA